MKKEQYLTETQVKIVLKLYYMKTFKAVSEDENITVARIKNIKENAFRIMRLSFSRRHMMNMPFDSEDALEYMALRIGMPVDELSSKLNGYIQNGLNSKDNKYWKRIKAKNEIPTASELLDFIYDKYEIEIIGKVE